VFVSVTISFCLQKSLLDPNWIPSLLGVSCLACIGRLQLAAAAAAVVVVVVTVIVITIVCNITWVNIAFVIVIISNGAGYVGRKPEVVDA
jgi:hypothetical protein